MSKTIKTPVKSDNFLSFCKALQEGQVCVFETDTVVGVGSAAFITKTVNDNNKNCELNISSIKKIFSIKRRDWNKKLPWLISDFNMLKDYALSNLDLASSLALTDWPGATTLILRVNESIDQSITQNSTIAFRCPEVSYLLKAMDKIGSPIVCTSANFSGENPVSKIKNMKSEFLDNVDFLYCETCDKTPTGTPSNIYDCSGDKIKKLR